MPKGLLESARLIAKVNGEWLPVNMKPRHVKQVQQRFANNGDTVEMEQTIYTCWVVLRDEGVWPGDLESFELALDDVGLAEEDDDPKSLTRSIAALAVVTGITPNDLMDTDLDMLRAMVDAVNERSK